LVVPVKFAPLMTTAVPTLPPGGAKLVITGAGDTAKLTALVAEPSGVVTMIGPVEAPSGTSAEMFVAELTVNEDAPTPLNLTLVARVNFVPRIDTEVPTGPGVGVKPVIVGGCVPAAACSTRSAITRPKPASRSTPAVSMSSVPVVSAA